VLADWRTAPIGEKLKAALAFIEKLTLGPSEVGPEDGVALERAGIDGDAAADLVHVCFAFSIIDRVADTLGFEVPSPGELRTGARAILERGYRLP
jgi:alkylhydroperoxidase family enzyme